MRTVHGESNRPDQAEHIVRVQVLPGEPAHFTGNWDHTASSASTKALAVRELS